MKVMHVICDIAPDSSNWGGAIKASTELVETLVQKGLDVTIFTTTNKVGRKQVAQDGSLTIQSFHKGFPAKWWTCYASRFGKVLNQEISKFDLIHIHELWHYPSFAACRGAWGAGKPYVVTIHGELDPTRLNYKALRKRVYAALIQRRILDKATVLHAVAKEEIEHIRALGVDSPVAVIPNGIKPEDFQELPSRKEFEEAYPEVKNKQVILFLSRIHPIKGLDLLAAAFGQVAKERNDVYLVIAGPDNEGYQSQVEEMLENSGVRDKTIFTGMLAKEEKRAALSRADIFVLPSYSDVRSLVALEAMTCKLPVILTRQCQFPEVAEEKAGFVIDPTPDQLSEALLKLLNNPRLRKEMGANGRQFVLEECTWDKAATQIIQLYEEILEKNVYRNGFQK